jgi:hypothetical protein
MNEASFFEHRESIQKLSHENLYELRTQPLELILLDQLIEVGGKQLENKAKMAAVDERVAKAQNVMFIMGITGFVELKFVLDE